MTAPYIGFGNDKLEKLSDAKKGMLIECLKCGGEHSLECGKSDGKEDDTIMFYECNGHIYLGAVAGKLVANVKPCCSGRI